MTVYVDNARRFRKAKSGHTYILSHMMADTADEMHAMALQLGLTRRYCQGDYYEVIQKQRRVALSLGAVELSEAELARRVGEQRRAAQEARQLAHA
jgi:hypothetical protein